MRARPSPVLGDLRRAYGISIILMILGASRQKRASLQKIHFLAHSVRTAKTREEAIGVFNGSVFPSQLHVRVEPWVNRALAFARAVKLIGVDQGKAAYLTEAGSQALAEIAQHSDLLETEKGFLQEVAAHATEARITKIMRMETLI